MRVYAPFPHHYNLHLRTPSKVISLAAKSLVKKRLYQTGGDVSDESSWGYAVNGAGLWCVKRGVFLSFALFWLKLLPPNGLLSTCCQFQNC